MLRKLIQWLTKTPFYQWFTKTRLTQWLKVTSANPLERSYLFLRQVIGIIGVSLPPVLIIGLILLERHTNILGSISSYYYSDNLKDYNVIGNIFVGSMCATGVFLICYRFEHLDDLFSTIAGICAIGVALFPTPPDNGATDLQMRIGIAHTFFASVFLSSLTFMVLVLFRRKNPDPSKVTDRKLQRNRIYLICGFIMLACIVIAALLLFIPKLGDAAWLQTIHPILLLEGIAVETFGIAWFVKGETFGIMQDKETNVVLAPEGLQNSATRTVATALGILAGLIGLLHGLFEMPQGIVSPPEIYINAIGSPCQGNLVWHQCFPAVTILPSFLVSGVISIIVSLIIIVWAIVFWRWLYGGQVLILLSIIQLLVGGGFISPVLGIIAGLVGLTLREPFGWLQDHLSDDWKGRLASVWPYSLIATGLWLVCYSMLGLLFNDFMLKSGLFSLFFAIGLMVLIVLIVLAVLSGFAKDMPRQQTPPDKVPVTST